MELAHWRGSGGRCQVMAGRGDHGSRLPASAALVSVRLLAEELSLVQWRPDRVFHATSDQARACSEVRADRPEAEPSSAHATVGVLLNQWRVPDRKRVN